MKELLEMATTSNIIDNNNSVKFERIKDVYLEIIMFFWDHMGDDTPIGDRAKGLFHAYHDSVSEVEKQFQDGDFKSEEDRAAIDDDLEHLYYMISDIDPSSPVLWSVHLVIEMIENGWTDIRMPR